jgi:hypothetical protein
MPGISAEDLKELTKDLPYPDGLTNDQCREMLKANFTQIDVSDVAVLFKALGLEQYTEAFVDEGYDDTTLFDKMEEEDLKDVPSRHGLEPCSRALRHPRPKLEFACARLRGRS